MSAKLQKKSYITKAKDHSRSNI